MSCRREEELGAMVESETLTRKEEEGGCDEKCREGKSSLRRSSKDSRSLASKGETIKDPRCTIKHRAEEKR